MEERMAGPGSLSILFFSTSKLVNAGATGGRVSLATADVVPGCVLTNNTGLIIRNKWRGIMSLFPLLSFFYLSLSALARLFGSDNKNMKWENQFLGLFFQTSSSFSAKKKNNKN